MSKPQKARLSKVLLSIMLAGTTASVMNGFIPTTVSASARPQCHGLNATIWVNLDNNHIMNNTTDTGVTYAGVLNGTSSADVIVGTSGPDVIHGNGQSDSICSLGGDDVIDSGNQDAWVQAGDGNDSVSTGNGKDTIDGGTGYDACDGGNGKDTITNCEADGSNDHDGVIIIKKLGTPTGSIQNFNFTGSLNNFQLQIGARTFPSWNTEPTQLQNLLWQVGLLVLLPASIRTETPQ